MEEKATLCLLGPSGGGKTSLLATLKECIDQQAYGYSARHSFKITAVSKKEYDAEGDLEAGPILRGFESGSYESLQQKFRNLEHDGKFEATQPAEGPQQYYFRVNLTGPAMNLLGVPTLVRVVDAAGELAAPPGRHAKEFPQSMTDLDAVLRETDAVILVLPLNSADREIWVSQLTQHVLELKSRKDTRVKRLVIVFSQYERMFVQLGAAGFIHASHPLVMQHAIRKAIGDKKSWLENFRPQNFDRQFDVRFTAASAFGFAKDFGVPNIDPNQSVPDRQEFRFLKGNSASELWRPFLTADPFIYAITGIVSEYIFTFEDLARPEEMANARLRAAEAAKLERAAQETVPPPQEVEEEEEVSREPWIKKVIQGGIDFFNANRDGR